MGTHLVDGRFQSDKYPECPRGKVPLSTKDPDAQDLLAIYAERHRKRDAEFSDDVQAALLNDGYRKTDISDLVKQARGLASPAGGFGIGELLRALANALEASETQRGLHVRCDVCRETITKFGAVLYGPPNAEGLCFKDHLCVKCYKRVG